MKKNRDNNKQVLESGGIAERVREGRDGVVLERQGLQTNSAAPRVRQLSKLVARKVAVVCSEKSEKQKWKR